MHIYIFIHICINICQSFQHISSASIVDASNRVLACLLETLFDKVKFVLNLVRCYVASVPLIKRGNSRPRLEATRTHSCQCCQSSFGV